MLKKNRNEGFEFVLNADGSFALKRKLKTAFMFTM